MRPELHFPAFRAVACALVATVLSGAARATESRADTPGALTNWQAAYSCFRTAGAFIAKNEYQRAKAELGAYATNLATPYNQLAQQFLIRLEAALNRPSDDEDGRLEGLTDLCMKLHAYPAAAQLMAAARTGSTPGEERSDNLRAWRLFENGKTAEAIAEYERKVAETSISTWQSYYKKQIELVQRRATNLTNVPFALEFVREHYLKGFEGKADLFCALNELNRVLAYAKEAKDGLLVYRSIIQCLSSLNDDAGRDAWEDKLLRDFKADQDGCAEVYVNRGIRAFLKNDFPQALVFFKKVCREYPNSEFYGDAQYDLGSTLQEQKQYDEAIEEYAKLFTCNVDEYKLVPGTSEDYRLYRHKAALRTSECYESKKDYARALQYAELAINQYKPLSWCSTCLKTAQEALGKRITKLQGLLTQTKDSTPAPGNPASPATSGPKIQFAGTVFDFGKVTSGETVRHDFVFTNIGTDTLEIKEVRPGCGCTTAGNWDKQVEPGKTGAIPLQFNSAGFSGTVTKSASVICNDAGMTNVILQLTGTVWKPITATPLITVFNVSSEVQTNETKVVRIMSDLEQPVELSDLQCTNRTFRTELKTIKEGKEFELAITAVPPFTSSPVVAPITMKTSSAKMPTLTVSAYLLVHEPVVVAPNQITLPLGPLAAAMSPTISIRNSGTNSMALSDASVNVPGAEVRVQEIQPGRLFSMAVNFPAGFQIKPDQKVEVTVKSNHPKFPLITVPVIQPQLSAVPVRTQRGSSQVQVVSDKAASPVAAGK